MSRRAQTASRRTPVKGPLALVAALLVAAAAALGSGAVTLPGSSPSAGVAGQEVSYTAWDEGEYPEYYRVVGAAVVDDEVLPGEIRYEGLDGLGRTGRVTANVTLEMAREGSERDREDMSWIHPSGWGHNEQVDIVMPDGDTYHGALFNRSHLLAKSLGGEEVPENMVTGTRTQNVGDNHGQDGGMAYTEGIARDWLWDHRDGTVYYCATPVYEGNELVPRSVIVDVRSSDGEIDQRVEVFNAVAGFEIDYATGEFWEV